MDYTNVLLLLNDCVERLTKNLEKQSLIGLSPWQEHLEELIGISELLNDPVISEPIDNYQIQSQLAVDKYGMASMVLTLFEENMSTRDIANQLTAQGITLTKKDIDLWLDAYKKAGITAKPQLVNGSIFDTQFQLQNVFDTLHEMLEDVKAKTDEDYFPARTTKDQVQLEYMKEIRMALKDASGLVAIVASMQTVEQFQKVVVEEVAKCDPATAHRIYKRIREAKSNFGALS